MSGVALEPLTAHEAEALAECEAMIDRGLAMFMEVGGCLLRIRDQRLYRAEFGTFEDYCRERWGMSGRHANRTIEAAETVTALGPMGPAPSNERVARELAPVAREDPDEARRLWAESVEQSENGQPTAAEVREVVRGERDPAPKPQREVLPPASWVEHLRVLVSELRSTVKRNPSPQVRERYRPGFELLDQARCELEKLVGPSD